MCFKQVSDFVMIIYKMGKNVIYVHTTQPIDFLSHEENS